MRLYHAVTKRPVELERLLRDLILVTPYRKPDRIGSLYIPEQAKADRTQTLWEVLLTSDGADRAVGMSLAGTIVQTLRRWPQGTGLVDADERPVMLWTVGCKACPDHPRGAPLCGLRGIITYNEEDDAHR